MIALHKPNQKQVIIRPLSKYMKELLMDIHERELLKLEPCEAATTKFSKGLILRGLLEIKDHYNPRGKKIVALFVTDMGRKYLDSLVKIKE